MISKQSILDMKIICIATAILVGSLVGGCATIVPPFDVPYIPGPKGESVPTVQSVIRKIECELGDIAGPNGAELDRLLILEEDLQAVVELSLSVTQDGKLAPTFSLIGTPFSFGTGFSYERSREQNFTTYLSFPLTILGQISDSEKCKAQPDTNLAGSLGLSQMFRLAISSGSFQRWDQKGSLGAFGGSITFTVDSQLTPTGPTWKLTTFQAPGPFLTASNKHVDKLTFGFVRGQKALSNKGRIDPLIVIANIRQNQIANSLQLLVNAR